MLSAETANDLRMLSPADCRELGLSVGERNRVTQWSTALPPSIWAADGSAAPGTVSVSGVSGAEPTDKAGGSKPEAVPWYLQPVADMRSLMVVFKDPVRRRCLFSVRAPPQPPSTALASSPLPI